MTKYVSWIKPYFTPVESTSPKVNNFNIIRFIAAFMVIYGHMSAVMGVPCFLLLTQRVSTIGVKIFFVISGYLITKSYLSDSHFGRYMIRRCFRIFPALIVLVLSTVLVLGPVMTSLPLSDYFKNPQTWQYLKNIFLSPVYSLPGVFTDYTYPNAINGSLWTLPVEFLMYLVLPLLVVIFKRLRALKPGIAICAALTLVLAMLHTSCFPTARLVVYGSNLPDMLPLLPYFFIGSLFSFPEMKKYLNLQGAVALLIAAVLLCPAFSNPAIVELIIALVLPYFVLSFSLTEKPIFANWFTRSDFSYGLYLYGFAVQQVLYHRLADLRLGVLAMSLISFAVALAFAMLSWYLVEKNAQGLGQKWIGRMKQRIK